MSNTIKISKEFHLNGGLWLGTEVEIPDNSTEEQKIELFQKEYATLVKTAQVLSGNSNPSPIKYVGMQVTAGNQFGSPPPLEIPSVDRGAKERLEIDIDNAETIEDLRKYEDDAGKQGIAAHWSARFIQIYDELQNN